MLATKGTCKIEQGPAVSQLVRKLEPFKMGSKPIKDILEELNENSEKIFGDDTKL